jgi:drug/metabolite transporter (DMT)-like permease
MSARAWATFAAVSTLWGIPYLFIKLAVDEVPPAFVAWSRVAIGAAVMLPLAWRLGLLRGVRGRLGAVTVYALCEVIVPFPLIAAGEQWVSSSLTAILIAAVPLLVAVLALRFDASERVHGARLVGLLIGLAGVALLVGIDVAGEPSELLGAGLILLGATGYAGSTLVIRRSLADVDPRATIAAALGVSTIALVPAVAVAPPQVMPSGTAIASLVVLGLACTALALALFVALVAEVGAGRATVITYVSPVVAVALGVTLLDERPGVGAVAGLLLILAGTWLSTGGRLPPGAAAFAARLRPGRERRGGGEVSHGDMLAGSATLRRGGSPDPLGVPCR